MFPMRNRQDLSAWLEKELAERNWSQSDLARYSGLHRAIISKIILGGSKPTPETIESIARAFKLPPEQVFRAAGLLPPLVDMDEDEEQIMHEIKGMPKDDQLEILAFIRMKRKLAELEAGIQRLADEIEDGERSARTRAEFMNQLGDDNLEHFPAWVQQDDPAIVNRLLSALCRDIILHPDRTVEIVWRA